MVAAARRVRTQAGVEKFDQPIGSVIKPDPTPSHGTMKTEVVRMPKATNIRLLAKDTDTKLAEIYNKQWALRDRMAAVAEAVHLYGGSVGTRTRMGRTWDRSVKEALTEFRGKQYDQRAWERQSAAYRELQGQLAELTAKQQELEAVYNTKGPWSRAFLVINNGSGHVHRTMGCSTCYPTTRFNWLPEYSGADEAEIVADAGERACTVCYPTAPVDVLRRATKIYSEDERRRIEERDARAKAKIEREAKATAKAISNPDGSDLVIHDFYDWGGRGEHLRTEAAARQWYVNEKAKATEQEQNPGIHGAYTPSPNAQRLVLEALAAKNGVTVEEMEAQLAPKVAAKVRKNAREVAAWAARYGVDALR